MSDDDQLIGRPLIVSPLASNAVTSTYATPPTATLPFCSALTITCATGRTTVSVIAKLARSLAAVMNTDPARYPVTTPPDETLATVESDEVHSTLCPVTAAPPESRTVAVNCSVCCTTSTV